METRTTPSSFTHETNNKLIKGSHLNIKGNNNEIIGDFNTITGNYCRISGCHNRLIGNHNRMFGSMNMIYGCSNIIDGDGNSVEIGQDNELNGFNNIKVSNRLLRERDPSPDDGENDDPSTETLINVPSLGWSIPVDRNRIPRSARQITNPSRPIRSNQTPSVSTLKYPTEQDIKQDQKATKEDPVCAICNYNKSTWAAIPCGHLSYCAGCASTICKTHIENGECVQCSLCRKQVRQMQRVFIS